MTESQRLAAEKELTCTRSQNLRTPRHSHKAALRIRRCRWRMSGHRSRGRTCICPKPFVRRLDHKTTHNCRLDHRTTEKQQCIQQRTKAKTPYPIHGLISADLWLENDRKMVHIRLGIRGQRLRVAVERVDARPAIQTRLLCGTHATANLAALALPPIVAAAATSGAARGAASRHEIRTGITLPGGGPSSAAIVCVDACLCHFHL